MQIIKPSYYDKFTCTAGRCPFTCCRDWKIGVDTDTFKMWSSHNIPGSNAPLSSCVTGGKNSRYIRLNEAGFCPLLTEDGLCKVVLAYGEEGISKTCHTFPREEHVFEDRVEQTLAAGCPAVVDLLFATDRFSLNNLMSDQQSAMIPPSASPEASISSEASSSFDLLFTIRDRFLDLIQDNNYSPSLALKMIFFIMLDIYDREAELTDAYIDDIFSADSLRELADAIRKISPSFDDCIAEQNELFLDLSENYRKEKKYTHILTPLAELAEGFEEDPGASSFARERRSFESILTSYEDKLRLLLAEELFSTLVMPEEGLYGMLLKLEWLGLYYAALSQALFLRYKEKGSLPYEGFREMIVILTRMTGYSDEDIEDYLCNSFETAIWDFGYMNLILG